MDAQKHALEFLQTISTLKVFSPIFFCAIRFTRKFHVPDGLAALKHQKQYPVIYFEQHSLLYFMLHPILTEISL